MYAKEEGQSKLAGFGWSYSGQCFRRSVLFVGRHKVVSVYKQVSLVHENASEVSLGKSGTIGTGRAKTISYRDGLKDCLAETGRQIHDDPIEFVCQTEAGTNGAARFQRSRVSASS